jgi:acetyl-CoA carboxylase carboxyltransferase component
LRLYRGDPLSIPADAVPPELEARLDHLFPQGWSALYAGGVIWGDGWVHGRETLVAGFVQGRPVDAAACWRFSQALLDLARDRPPMPFVILLDTPGQAGTIDNEQLVLSEFIAQAAAVVHALRTQGKPVELWLTGEAGGAIYVALAAAANTVTAWPGARVQTLPARVVSGVIGTTRDQVTPVSELLEARVIDRWTRAPGFAEPPSA